MANKWRTTTADANAVLVKYSVNPNDLSTETIIQAWEGIDRTVVDTLVAALKAIKSVDDPVIDNQTYDGTWNVKDVYSTPVNSGNLAGSSTIYRILSSGYYAYATPGNVTIARSRAYPIEQNENAWMYYERFKLEETKRWTNMTYDGLTEDVFDGMRQIRTATAFANAVIAADDKINYAPGSYAYYQRKWLNCIVYADSAALPSNWPTGLELISGYTQGKFYIPETAVYQTTWTALDWWFDNWEEISDPVIRECWYEINSDGTYTLYRSLESTSSPAIKRTRSLQYAGMILVSGLPVLDDTAIALTGFNRLTEIIYQHARFRIGGDVYRVTAEVTAANGTVTVSITPAVTQATEDACAADSNQVQVYFEAV